MRRPEAANAESGVPCAMRCEQCTLYQPLTRAKRIMATSAPHENQAMLRWPFGSTMNAAGRGPSEDPPVPPRENSDCANPYRPPDARRAMRAASGWKIADPSPMNPTDSRIAPKPGALDSRMRPATLEAIPAGNAKY